MRRYERRDRSSILRGGTIEPIVGEHRILAAWFGSGRWGGSKPPMITNGPTFRHKVRILTTIGSVFCPCSSMDERQFPKLGRMQVRVLSGAPQAGK